MMGFAVCGGAQLMCPFGMAPSVLNVLPNNKTISNMPIANMYIFTETGKPVTTKNYIEAELMIIGAKNPADDITATLQIKGRGNSSWNPYALQKQYDSKNSYRLKLDEK